jgi:hypothetical protein
MTFDAKIPESLKRTQTWFGSIIARPIDVDSQMEPISPSGVSMEVESALYITPSPTLRPAQRIQIYNQQYWWRLLATLHEIFPLVTRLFGYFDFNRKIGIPYLDQYPPNDWSLNNLGNRLPQWIEDEYQEEDKPLVRNAASIDLAYNLSFFSKKYPPIMLENLPVPGDPASLFDCILYLQPHIYLFELKCDLFHVREEMLKQEPEHWIENDFPALPRDKQPYYFVLFRNHHNHIAYDSISFAAYQILKLFKQGSSVEQVCQWLEGQDEKVSEESSQKLQFWFQEWMIRQWFYAST